MTIKVTRLNNCRMKKILFVFIAAFIYIQACQSSKSNIKDSGIGFIRVDTIQSDDVISLNSYFGFDYGKLTMINTFRKDSVFDKEYPFVRDLYQGFSINYNNYIYTNIVGLGCSDCINYFGVYNGDSIDNIEGFNPLVVENGITRYLIMEGYYAGCNGSFCNFGSILVLKFKEKELQQVYLFGIDKTIYSISRAGYKIQDDESLYLQMHSDNSNNTIDLTFTDRIKLEDRNQESCEHFGIMCIK